MFVHCLKSILFKRDGSKEKTPRDRGWERSEPRRRLAADPSRARQPTPARACFKPMLAHQSLDPVQSTGHAFGEQIVPHTPGAVRPIADAGHSGPQQLRPVLYST